MTSKNNNNNEKQSEDNKLSIEYDRPAPSCFGTIKSI